MVGRSMTDADRHFFRMSAGEIICLVTMVYAPALAFTPIRIFSVAGNSAWLAVGLAGLFGGVITLMWVRLTTMFPDQILPQFVETILGTPIGKVVNLTLCVQFFFIVSGNARIVAEVMFILMPDTPLLFFVVSSIVLSMIIVRLGPEVMGRMAVVILLQLSVGAVLMVMALVPDFRWNKFLPILAEGFEPIFRASITPTAFLADISMISFFVPHLAGDSWPQRQNSLFKKVLIIALVTLIIVWLLPATLLILEQAVIGPEAMARVAIPGLTLVRQISIGTFFERVEAGLVAIWLPAILMKIILFLYATAVMVQHIVGSRAYRFYVVPIGVLAMPMGYTLAPNLPKLVIMLNGTMSVTTLVFQLLILITLLCVALVKRRTLHGR